MDDEKLKKNIGINIAYFRKKAGLTQMGLAERLNYSDKAVSKWERGESLPDVVTLTQLAEQFGITVNDLLTDPDALPEEVGSVQHAMEQVVEKTLKRKANKNIILALSSLLVWFVALLVFVVCGSFGISLSWLSFVAAVPVNSIVALTLLSAWHDYRWNQALISVMMWGTLISVYLLCLVLGQFNLWRILLLGVPGQIAILLWFRLFLPTREKHKSAQP